MAKKKTKNTQKNTNAIWAVIALLSVGIVLLAVVLFSHIVHSRNMIDQVHLGAFERSSRERVNRDFVVDPSENRMYIPHLGVALPYDPLVADNFSYRTFDYDDSRKSGSISFHHNHVNSVLPSDTRHCISPFVVTVDAELPSSNQQYELKHSKTLDSGRKLEVYVDETDVCRAYISSMDGQDMGHALSRLADY